MENNKNKIIIITLLLIIMLVGIGIAVKFVFFKKDNQYIFLHENMLWEKNENEWKQLNSVNDDLLEQKYTLYDGNNHQQEIAIKKTTSGWYYFNKDYKQIKPTNLRGVSNIEGIKFADYKKEFEQNSNAKYIKSALFQIGINSSNGYFTSKVTYDFDNNGERESIYITSNYSFNVVDYKIHSVVYQVKNGKVSQIIDKANDLPFDFFEILDIDKDGKYEIILTYGVKNLPGLTSCYKMYKLNGGKWEVIKQCS